MFTHIQTLLPNEKGRLLMQEEYVQCFSCGAKSMNFEGDSHEYLLASAGCYEMFNEVLEREYSVFTYARAHHYTVDAYTTQHPGKITNQKAVNSVGIHLISLYFLFEKGFELEKAAEIKMKFAQFNKLNNIVKPLERPKTFNGLTIFDIWDNENSEKHFELCAKWAADSWHSWLNQHGIIENWANTFIKEANFSNHH